MSHESYDGGLNSNNKTSFHLDTTREPVISVNNLSYSYGKTQAVNDISFAVKKGEIFSFLGPNGAGKTTTINLLTTLLPMQSGKVSISGFDVEKQPDEVRQVIGIVFQNPTVDWNLTVWESLEFHGRIYSMPKDVRRKRIIELLELVELVEKRNTLVKHLSGGMKRRLEIARGLLTRPEVLFLDEPTMGLDPSSRMKTWDYVKKINEEGVTVFLTTHYMDEADQLSDTICILDRGKIIANGTSESLKNAIGRDMIYLQTDDDAKSARIAEDIGVASVVRSSAEGIIISLKDGSQHMPKLIERIREEKVEIMNVNLKKPTLDDVFLYFTGRGLREDNNDNHQAEGKRKGG
jgi:ABC-2 type transport system ATP-binding protein